MFYSERPFMDISVFHTSGTEGLTVEIEVNFLKNKKNQI